MRKRKDDQAEEGQEAEGSASSGKAELSLEERLEAAEVEAAEANEKWRRAQADYQNLRRRSLQDLEGALRRTTEPLLQDLLRVLDYLDMALMSPTESQDAQNLAMGVQMTRDELWRTLEAADVTAISTQGTFDPECHEALERVPDSGTETGTILGVTRKGYRRGDFVLRHAQVRVAGEPEPDPAPDHKDFEQEPQG